MKTKKRPLVDITNEEHYSDSDENEKLPVRLDEADNEQKNTGDERAMHTFAIGLTQKGADAIWYEGFRYVHTKGNAWRCTDRKCRARVVILEDNGQTMNGYFVQRSHSHMPPGPAHKERENRRNEIKEKVRQEPNIKPNRLLTQVRRSVNDETFVAMGSDLVLKQMMKREKTKFLGNVDSADVLKINLPPMLVTKDGENIVLYDSRLVRPSQKDVVFVFANNKLLRILAKARTWHIDGTFKASPANWVQCFVIGASINNKMIICAHALLPGKAERFYREALEAVINAIQPAVPIRVIMDLEKAEMLAVRLAIPGAVRSACMFHYGQAIYRQFKELGLVPLYAENTARGDGVRKAFRGVLALPLLPPEHVRRAFVLIVQVAPVGLENFFYYFARVYVGLTEDEKNRGVAAFAPTDENSDLNTTPALSDHSYSIASRQSDAGIRFGIFSPRPSTPSIPSTVYSPLVQYSSTASTVSRQSVFSVSSGPSMIHPVILPRWEQPIVKNPQYEIAFWNVHEQAANAMARTNNGLESSHLHFMRNLNHHPALSDFIIAVRDDMDKQVVAARSARNFMHKRHERYVIQEHVIMRDLQNPIDYGDNLELMDFLTSLGLQMQGYAGKLRDALQTADDEAINESQ